MTRDLLSIRLSADGLYFWTGDKAEGYDTPGMAVTPGGEADRVCAGYYLNDPGRPAAEVVREAVDEFRGILAARGTSEPGCTVVYGDTPETVLVPADVFREEDTDRYLALHGFAADGDRYAVCTKPLHGTVAVLVLDQTPTRVLGQELGSFMVAAPLQYNLCSEAAGGGNGADCIRVFTTPHRCHVTVLSGGSPTYCEVLPLGSAADLIYYLSWLANRFGSAAWPVTISGERAGELCKAVGRRYNASVCG